MNTLTLLSAAVVTLAANMAMAHDGPRIWIDASTGKIVTYAGPYPDSGNAADYHADRVFSIEMSDTTFDDDGVDWQTSFPGYQRLPAGSIASPTTFALDIAGEPLWYNPGAGNTAGTFQTLSQHFGGTGTPRFAIENSLGQAVYSGTGAVSGLDVFQYTAAGSHGHAAYSLLGLDNGTSPGGVDGIYALPLQLRAPGLTSSQTFYLVLGKNADATQLATAEAVLEGSLIPEPASLAMLLLSGLVLRRHRA